MIMTSFYFSIGGILVLILYGLHRYFMLQDSLGKKIRFLDFSETESGFRSDPDRFDRRTCLEEKRRTDPNLEHDPDSDDSVLFLSAQWRTVHPGQGSDSVSSGFMLSDRLLYAKQQEEARPLWRGLLPYILTIILIFTGNTESMPSFSRFLLALDVVIMAGCYLLFYELTRFGIRTNRKSLRTGSVLCLLIPPILFLGIYDQSFQTQADTMLDSGFIRK